MLLLRSPPLSLAEGARRVVVDVDRAHLCATRTKRDGGRVEGKDGVL
jgi:hypothetical protein